MSPDNANLFFEQSNINTLLHYSRQLMANLLRSTNGSKQKNWHLM